MKLPAHELTCSLYLLFGLDILASHSVGEHFFADWYWTLNECVRQSVLPKLQVQDVEVFAAHIVANYWNAYLD